VTLSFVRSEDNSTPVPGTCTNLDFDDSGRKGRPVITHYYYYYYYLTEPPFDVFCEPDISLRKRFYISYSR
jgi:hypothetical protein